jgi:hypothetical protein
MPLGIKRNNLVLMRSTLDESVDEIVLCLSVDRYCTKSLSSMASKVTLTYFPPKNYLSLRAIKNVSAHYLEEKDSKTEY